MGDIEEWGGSLRSRVLGGWLDRWVGDGEVERDFEMVVGNSAAIKELYNRALIVIWKQLEIVLSLAL